MAQIPERSKKYGRSVAAPVTVTHYHWPRIIGALCVLTLLLTLVWYLVGWLLGPGVENEPQVAEEIATVDAGGDGADDLADGVAANSAETESEQPADPAAQSSEDRAAGAPAADSGAVNAVAAVTPAAVDTRPETSRRTTVALSLDGPTTGAAAGADAAARTGAQGIADAGLASLPSEPTAAGMPALKATPGTLPAELTVPADEAGESEEALPPAFDLSRVDKRLVRVQLTSGLRDQQPVDQLARSLVLHESGIMRVYLFTEMRNLKGATVIHDWQRNGKSVAKVRIRPHTSPIKASSSKFIDRRMSGEWKVVVKTASGQLLGEFPFVVTLPPSLARN